MIRSRRVATVFIIALCSAAAYPVALPLTEDSFPLSTYPMFTSRRGKPLIHRAEALLESGRSWIVPPELIAGDEALQTKVMLRQAVQHKGRVLRDLCRRIAHGVGQVRDDAEHVEIVGVRFEPVAYFTTGPQPVSRDVYAKCRVESRAGRGSEGTD